MKIVVPIKYVPETEIRVKIAGDGKSVDLANVKMILNPFDEFAIEEALKLRDAAGDGSVTVITVGEADAVQALRTGLAMGANEAVRVKLEDAPGSDARAVASILAEAIKGRGFDLVICGKNAVGTDQNVVPQMLASYLGIPSVTTVSKLEFAAGTFTAIRQIEGKAEVVKTGMPALLSLDKGVNEPRYPSLKGIMAAKRAAVEEISISDLGVDAALLGEGGSSFELVSIEMPPARGAAKIIEAGDDPQGAAQQLVDWLKNDAKVI